MALRDLRERSGAAEDAAPPSGSSPEAPAASEGAAPARPALSAETVGEGLRESPGRGKGGPVNLNFVDADLTELVRAVSLATGKRFIIGPKVRQVKASIFSPQPVSASEAYQAFLSVLSSSGMTVVPAGRYLKIVESDEAARSAIPLCLDGEDCEGGDRLVTRLHRLHHVGAEEVAQVLSSLVSEHGGVTAYVPTNTLIVTDYARNLRRLLRLVQELDVEGPRARIWVEPVHHAAAEEVAELIRQVFEGQGAEGASKTAPAPRRAPAKGRKAAAEKARPAAAVGSEPPSDRPSMIVADPRTNQLVIVGSERAYMMVLQLLAALDTALEDDGEMRVHKLENADAEELAKTLQSLAKSGGASTPSKGKRAAATPGGSLFDGEVQITADKGTNSLVIVGSARDYASLREVIDVLDAERRQVFVEAVIVEVGLDGTRDLGLAFHGGTTYDHDVAKASGPSLAFGGTAFQGGALQSMILSPSVLQGLALGLRGPAVDGVEADDLFPDLPAGISIPAFGVVLQALQQANDVNVLSTPHILAMDNEEAEIEVGQNVPVSTSFLPGLTDAASLLGEGEASSAASSLFTGMSLGRQTVGVKLGITPHINQSDQVRLEVDVEVSEIAGGDSLLPNIGQRTLKTKCIVGDQQTVVLGGLVSDKVLERVEKVPVLGDVPILGHLFKRTSRITEKRNLLIFLTPYIVRDSSDFRRIFARKMQERREFIDRFTAFEYHEVQPHLDYERTSGLLEEIRRSVDEIDEEEARRELLDAVEEPEHLPRPPIDAGGVVIEPPAEPGSSDGEPLDLDEPVG